MIVLFEGEKTDKDKRKYSSLCTHTQIIDSCRTDVERDSRDMQLLIASQPSYTRMYKINDE